MSTDLVFLAWSAALCGMLWVPYIVERVLNWGLVDAVGYPDNPPEAASWARRAQRAHLNLAENLPVFATLALIAHAAGVANEMTALGSALFFYARLAHAIVFIIGISWLRTLSFVVSWVGMLLIFLQIVM
ncbi:MAG: MAPEG family protein [Alphaproteobacteria bacterium]|nr:MAPEG family protein [Alphaproteobacteria bacterium]